MATNLTKISFSDDVDTLIVFTDNSSVTATKLDFEETGVMIEYVAAGTTYREFYAWHFIKRIRQTF